MQENLFGLFIIENLDDMEEALESYDLDEFYVSIDHDRDAGWKAYFYLQIDGEPLAETDGWHTSKKSLIDDVISVFSDDVDIVDF